MTVDSENKWFETQLRMALTHLYNPQVLRNSPLVKIFGLNQQHNVVSSLRASLTKAIESLRPAKSTPTDTRSRRVYQVLRRRYIEQINQREVANELGLSVRQLQREEKAARNELAVFLWDFYNLDANVVETAVNTPSTHKSTPNLQSQTHSQELESLKDSVPLEKVNIGEVIEKVLETITPLKESLNSTISYNAKDNVPKVLVRLPLLRQALVSIVSNALHVAPGGNVDIEISEASEQLVIFIRAIVPSQGSEAQITNESLEMAKHLIKLCRGSLKIVDCQTPEEVLSVKVSFASSIHTSVLVIDDNADTLQLYQRHLSNSRYRFVGTQDAAQGLAMAQELSPQVIILDVMMPEYDGWTVLSQLRKHPETEDSFIIVCTILPQESLAETLGADAFIRKPVSRTMLLSTLDHHFDPLLKEPD